MLSEDGNPSMDNLAAILRAVREKLGVDLQAHAVEARERLRRRIPLAANQRAVMEPGGKAGSERGKEARPIEVHPVRTEAGHDWALITAP